MDQKLVTYCTLGGHFFNLTVVSHVNAKKKP